MYDYIIKRGTIADGTGEDCFTADLGIKDGRISFIGDMKGSYESGSVIDGLGLTVSPGFINMHSHGDQTLFLYPRGEGTVKQGITTCYCGNCGATPGPIDKVWVRKFWEYDAWDEVDPYVESANTILPAEKVIPVIEKYFNTKIDWRSIGEYMEKLENEGISYNYIANVGHGDIRAQVMGDDNRKPDASEMSQMKRYLEDALDAGVYGMTTGMDYAPGNHADLDELSELIAVVKEYDGIYTTHWKNRGKDPATRIDGLMEAFEVARRTGTRLHVNHLTDLFFTVGMLPGETASIRAGKTLRYIDNAKNEGIDFIFDVIPNTSGGFEYVPYLTGYFMPWIRISGSVEQFIQNLKKHDFTGWLRDWLRAGRGGMINPNAYPEWSKWLIIVASENKDYIGKSIEEIYDIAYDTDYMDTVLRLLAEEPLIRTKVVRFDRDIVREFIRHDLALIGTDSFNFDGLGTFGGRKNVPDILAHPNTFSGMVSYIMDYGAPRLEDTIRRITGKPADWLRLDRRGYLKEGYFADIAVFDPKALATNEDYLEPCRYPSGVRYVFVNGTMVVCDGEHTEEKPGRVLRR